MKSLRIDNALHQRLVQRAKQTRRTITAEATLALESYLETIEDYHSDDRLARPWGCKCGTLGHELTGDGCDECNPDYGTMRAECG